MRLASHVSLPVVLLVFGTNAVYSAPTFTAINHGAASPDESSALNAINDFRADPQNELYEVFQGFGYTGTKAAFDGLLGSQANYPGGNWWTNNFGSNAMTSSMDGFMTVPKTLVDQFASLPAGPMVPYVWSDNLGWAAHQYAVWVELDGGATSNPHAVSGAPTFASRFTDNGVNWSGIAENIAPDFPLSIGLMHAAFAVDWGNGLDGIQNPPGHRNNMLSSGASFTHAGIGIIDAGWTASDVTQVQHFADQLSTDSIVYGYVTDETGDRFANVVVEVFNNAASLGVTTTDATGAYTVQYSGGTPTSILYTTPMGASFSSSAMGSSGSNFFLDAQIDSVPEPSAFLFLGIVGAGFVWVRTRMANRSSSV